MNKADLIKTMAAEAGITQNEANKAFNAMVDGIADALAKKDRVILVGFGTFSVTERKARTGRNPKTGAPLKIPARRVPKFTPGKALKERI